MQVKGTVQNVYSKTKSTRAGDKTIWYADIDDGTTINMGFKALWEEGEYVTVNVEEKYGELQVARGGSKMGGGSKPAPAAKSAGSTYKAKSFPLDATDQQVSIIRQSSLNRAVEVATLLYDKGELSTEEQLMNKIWELAYEFTDFGTGQREVKAAEERAIKRAALEAVNG